MKRLIGLFSILGLVILAGCFDTAEEVTINDNGSGVFVNSIDMGKMISALAAMGGDEKMKDAEKIDIDTTILMKSLKDSIKGLSDTEKRLLENGTAHLVMNLKEEKFNISFSLPFAKTAEIPAVKDVLRKSGGRIMENMMSKLMPEGKNNAADDDMQMSDREGIPDVDGYFIISYEKNKITCKLNKEKYAKAEDDESLKSLKEMGQMGMPLNLKTVINLPKPAKKTTGKGVVLSDDKKKVTIEGTLDDFFEDPSKFEYEIEY